MGSKHSKAHPRVTRVAPMQDKDPMFSPVSPVDLVFNDNLEDQSLYSFARLREKKRTLDRQLPPLRETLYGRYSSGLEVPRPMSVDIPLEKGETSIIKRHPPRRFQLNNLQTHTELKRSLHREARIDKHKMRELKAKSVLENMPRNDGREDFETVEPDVSMNGEMENAWNREFIKYHESSENHPRNNGELRRWFLKQQVQDELFWDSSSTNSDELGKEERKPWTLVRTNTERISLFDEFFTQD
ncbi:factor associated with metabolism and energy [Petaurus breviceps papuanus]|uniref:factor associated with metabolism and energy n=1 Tax=Petaurus breviceps papuanus TaxID=3040969 RepID=UPI0036D78176